MPDFNDKQPQKTPPEKNPPPKVAKTPPETAEGRRQYDEETLEQSSDYADDRSEDARKPYSTESEAYSQKVKKNISETGTPGNDEPAGEDADR
jgi:hypothetical protein